MLIAPVTKADEGAKTAKKDVMMMASAAKGASTCSIRYHVTDAKKYLASVTKMTQCGNRVIFDSDEVTLNPSGPARRWI